MISVSIVFNSPSEKKEAEKLKKDIELYMNRLYYVAIAGTYEEDKG